MDVDRFQRIERVIISLESWLRRRINLPVKPKVTEERRKATSCKKQPRREVKRDQTSFSRAPPRIGRRFFLRGKKLTSGSDQWRREKSHGVCFIAACLPDSLSIFFPCIYYHR